MGKSEPIYWRSKFLREPHNWRLVKLPKTLLEEVKKIIDEELWSEFRTVHAFVGVAVQEKVRRES